VATLADSLTVLGEGAHLVTATKSHLVHHWAELEDAGRSSARAIRVSAACGAALPAADLARRGVRSFGCQRIRGSLNGTSNFVLNEMARGSSLAAAIARAQSAGIAEPDPGGDLDGSDAASKLVILANLLWHRADSFEAVVRDQMDALAEDLVRRTASEGRAVRSIATATSGSSEMTVRYEAVDGDDSFFILPGAEKAVEFDGPAGRIVVTGGRSSPRGAALALLKDVTNILTGDDVPAFG
jgi:homoserine dehydrogenase